MLEPLRQWICDVCGEVIDTPEAGLVTWRRDDNYSSYSFKIVHRERCDLKTHWSSLHLTAFVGEPGLTYLMSFLSPGPLIVRRAEQGRPEVNNLDEFVDLVRRVQTPYYEEARCHFRNPDVLEHFETSNEVDPYFETSLRRIISIAGDEGNSHRR